MTPVDLEPSGTDRGSRAVRVLLTVVVAGFAVFWIWALFFASKEAVNRIDDRDWAARAESICVAAEADLIALADLRTLDDPSAALIRERADIVDRATDVLEGMVDDVVATTPSDEKGQAIVPLWEADYRTYVADRRAFADDLRRTGENLPFYETAVGGIPISERLATFAGDNEMSSCAPPVDLSR